MKTAVKYFGGKSGIMTKNIINMFPTNRKVFVDVFGGSGVILMNQKSKVEIYNDIFQNIYSLYKVISDKKLYKEFQLKCELSIYSEQLRKEYKQLLKTKLSLIDRAFYYFYVNRTSHNGHGGFAIDHKIRAKRSKSIQDYLSTIEKLPTLHERLKNVIVRNTDALELIEKENNPNTLLYLDPPYHHSTRSKARYEVDFTDEQHERLIDLCLTSKSKILLSGYDNFLYDKLIKAGWNKKQFKINTVNFDNTPKTKIETIWYNYKIENTIF